MCAAGALAVPVVVVLGGPNDARADLVATDPAVDLPAPVPIGDNPGWWDMPATEMLRRLEDITPSGRSYREPAFANEGENAPGEPFGVVRGWLAVDVMADGKVAGGINVVLYRPGSVSSDRYTCPGNLVEADRCSEVTDDEGEAVGRTSVTTTGPITVREAVLLQPGGGVVYVAASNSADDKWGPGSTPASDDVPFTSRDLLDIASYRQWTTYVPR